MDNIAYVAKKVFFMTACRNKVVSLLLVALWSWGAIIGQQFNLHFFVALLFITSNLHNVIIGKPKDEDDDTE